MDYSFNGNGTKYITASPEDNIRALSDDHIPPSAFESLMQNTLTQLQGNGKFSVNDLPPNIRFGSPFVERLFPPNPAARKQKDICHQLMVGDMISAFPSSNGNAKHLTQGFNYLDKIIQINNLTGNDLTFFTGNHLLRSQIPQSLLEQLTTRGIIADKVTINYPSDPRKFSIQHGHEYDPRNSLGKSGYNNPIYTWFDHAWNRIRAAMGLNNLPFESNIVQALMLTLNSHQIASAVRGLNPGDVAICGHTHFPDLLSGDFLGISIPNPQNLMAKENLLEIIGDNKLAKGIFLVLRRLMPNITGTRVAIPSELPVTHVNLGYRDTQKNEIQTGADIHQNSISLIGFNPNKLENGDIWKQPGDNIKELLSVDLNKIQEAKAVQAIEV